MSHASADTGAHDGSKLFSDRPASPWEIASLEGSSCDSTPCSTPILEGESKWLPPKIYKAKEVLFSSILSDSYQSSNKDFRKRNIDRVALILLSFLRLLVEVLDSIPDAPVDLDPHVGDTSCQIRAVMILCIFNSKEFLSWVSDNRLSYKGDIHDLERHVVSQRRVLGLLSSQKSKMDSIDKVLSFLLLPGMKSIRRWELVFLALCYGLSDPDAPAKGSLSSKFLQERLHLTGKLAEARAKEMQIILSRISVDFVIGKIGTGQDQVIPLTWISPLLTYFRQKDTMGRDILPIFFASIMLTEILKKIRPLIELRLFVEELGEELKILYQPSDGDEVEIYEPFTAKSQSNLMPCILIFLEKRFCEEDPSMTDPKGFCDRLMSGMGIFRFLELSAAVHPQLKHGVNIERAVVDETSVGLKGEEDLPKFERCLFSYSDRNRKSPEDPLVEFDAFKADQKAGESFKRDHPQALFLRHMQFGTISISNQQETGEVDVDDFNSLESVSVDGPF